MTKPTREPSGQKVDDGVQDGPAKPLVTRREGIAVSDDPAQGSLVSKRAGASFVNSYEEFPRTQDHFGRIPTVQGENPVRYLEFRRKLDEDLRPKGMIEGMFVETVGRLYWDFITYSTLKTDFLSSTSTDGVERLLRAMLSEQDSAELFRRYRARDLEAVSQVQRLIDSLGIDRQQVAAQALAKNLTEVQKIEGLISAKEKGWQKALKNLEQHRELLARRFRALTGIKESEHFRGFPANMRS